MKYTASVGALIVILILAFTSFAVEDTESRPPKEPPVTEIWTGEPEDAGTPAEVSDMDVLKLDDNMAAQFYADVAKAYSKYGRYPKAIALYEFAIKRADSGLNIAELYHGLGTAYTYSGKQKEAVEYLEKSVELAPDLGSRTDYSYNLASAYRAVGEIDKAIEAYQFVVDSSKDSIWKESARRQLFYLFRDKNLLDDYIQRYEQQAKEDPKNVNPLINLAEIYASVKYEPVKAVEYFETAYKIKPDDKRLRDRLAQMYESSREYEKALVLYKKIAEEAEDNMKAYSYERVSNLYAQLNRREDAIEWAGKILELDKKDTYAYMRVASIYIRFEEYDKAAEMYRQSMEVSKEPFQKESSLYQLGNLYERIRKYDEAEKVYQEIINNDIQSYYDEIAKNQLERVKQLRSGEKEEKKPLEKKPI